MILVNLLPKELRPKEAKKSVRIPFVPILVGLFFLFAAVALYNLFVFSRVGIERRKLEAEWEKLKKPSMEAEQLQREMGSTMMAELVFYDNFIDPILKMAKVMNLLVDELPVSIWLNNLSVERKQNRFVLLTEGFSESVSSEAKLVEIQNFVTKIKDEIEPLLKGTGSAKEQQPAAVKKDILKVSVTTSSKQDSGRANVTQFSASIKTEESLNK